MWHIGNIRIIYCNVILILLIIIEIIKTIIACICNAELIITPVKCWL